VAATFICADYARDNNIPDIDAGHVVNLLNNKVYKSWGHRPYSFKGIYA
jgi:hypothetical protein